ncbi:MAG TPA: TatD family deoxyribonuclease [Lutibacter sp.]|nr:TatD family deoxyribonuclease [Lutibacter sp.]
MLFTDTHTHLYSEKFDEDRNEVIQRALANNVKRFFVPAIDSSYTSKMYELEAQHPESMFLMAGLHPTSVKGNYKKELKHVAEQLNKRNFIAIGEIGIDLYWDKTHLKEQKEAFQTQIRWAKERKLPIAIHCRDAFDEIFEVLELEKGAELFGIFHCFTGNYEQALKAMSYNMKLGIGGVVTFKNGKIDQFLNQIPLTNIVLETDAPYLTPTPHRGKRNESSYIPLIAQKLAEVYGVDLETIAKVTTQNSIDLFGV